MISCQYFFGRSDNSNMKMLQKSLLIAAVLAGAATAVSAADITGKVTLKGTPPPEKKLPLDPVCAKMHTEIPTTRFYVVDKDGGLADAFVYIKEGLSQKEYPAPKEPAVLDQKGCEYLPYVLGAQTGQTIVVKNSDPVLHNVHPTPTVAGNKEYNKAQLPKGPDVTFSWEKPEIFLRFKCDVHPWMYAYVGLVDNPYFAVSKEDGTFTIKNVPPGKYTVEVYHRKAGKETKEITVGAQNATADFTLEVK